MRLKPTIRNRSALATLVFFVFVFPLWSHAANTCEDLFFIGAPAITASARPLDTVSQIKIMTYNVENFFLPSESDRSPEEKPLVEQKGIARAIADENPDFIVLEEVGGLTVLETFSKNFLNDSYKAYLVPGNDQRGIEIGYLVKRDLPLRITLESHREATWMDPTDHRAHRLFSRDAPALMVRAENVAEDSAPLLILIGNHAKAMRDRAGDPKSELLRGAQYDEIGRIIDGYRSTYGADVPLLLGGDFNADVQRAHSIDPVRTRMADPFDLMKTPDVQRVTHTYHPKDRRQPSEFAQLDALLVAPALASNIIDIKTYRYKDKDGDAKPLPTTFDERKKNPSDHFPVVLTLSTRNIFPARAAGL